MIDNSFCATDKENSLKSKIRQRGLIKSPLASRSGSTSSGSGTGTSGSGSSISLSPSMESGKEKLEFAAPASGQNTEEHSTPHGRRVFTELNGTPSIALRKGILNRQLGEKQAQKDIIIVSPTLQNLNATPSVDRIRSTVAKQLESSSLADSFVVRAEKESPGLIRLRQTPGKPLREKQQCLVNKHNETRQHADSLNIGGGVTLWPEMTNMRLTRGELTRLTMVAFILLSLTYCLFNTLHGSTVLKLEAYNSRLEEFMETKHLDLTDASSLQHTALLWHEGFSSLVSEIEQAFLLENNQNLRLQFYMIAGLYVSGICLLLYYLADNVMSANKLSPRRIKRWVCLLMVVGCWTVNMSRLFIAGLMVEQSVQDNIYHLNSYQKQLIYNQLDSHTYDRIHKYWTVEYLSHNSRGTLNILGIIQFNFLLHYIQYYSLPIVTALITPIFKLVLSLLHVYGIMEQKC